jgi:zinc protease
LAEKRKGRVSMKKFLKSTMKKVLLYRILTLFMILCILTSAAVSSDSSLSSSFLEGVKREVLPSGVTVITQTNNGPPLVSINFFVNTGSINENDKNVGVSHFCEHMFYRGTEERDNIEMKTAIENLGGNFNAETSKDMTRFYVNVPSEYGIEAFKIYADALMNASYDNEHVEKERKVVLEECRMLQESPMSNLHDKIYSLAFQKHPYRLPTIGTEENIKRISRDELYAYKNTWYSPENLVVVIVGNFNRDEYLRVIREKFARFPAASPRPFASYPPEKITETKILKETKPFDSNEAYFVMVYNAPGIKDVNDVVAIDVLLFMMGQGKGSLLEKEIGRKFNWARRLGVDFLTSKDPGLILFSARVNPGKIDELGKEIVEFTGRIKQGSFSAEDMNRAKNMLVRTYIYGLETNEGKAQNLGFYEILGGMDFTRKYVDRINSITKEDLTRAANRYFGEHYILYAIKPEGRK